MYDKFETFSKIKILNFLNILEIQTNKSIRLKSEPLHDILNEINVKIIIQNDKFSLKPKSNSR